MIQPEQYLICYQNRRKSETFELMPEISWKYSSPKILDCRSEKPQLILKFHTVFAVIFFSKICNSNRTNTRVLITIVTWLWKRVIFAQWWLDLEKNAHKWLIATDEAYFYLTESINKQNNRMWLNERPEDWIEKPLHVANVLVWCAISWRKIYGPYFFVETVNQHKYLDML